jgi:pimeloyl-ACP methyl ester carboxylesterase
MWLGRIAQETTATIMLFASDRPLRSPHPAAKQVWRTVAALGFFWVFVWLLAVVVLWAAEPYLVFMTGTSRANTAPFDPRIFHESTLRASDGLRLQSVLLVHDANPNRYWILFCPPAGASIHVRRLQDQLQQLWTLGYNVMAFDYRGFGGNSGTPTEEGLYADATTAYDYLVNAERVKPSRVILAGRSLGSAVAIDLATRVEAGGLLLFGPIDSVPSVAARLFPWAPVRLLLRCRFDNLLKARVLDLPVILFYGMNDGFVPLSDARSMFQEFRGPKLMVSTGGGHHHSGFVNVSQLYQALAAFWPPETATARR